MGDKTKIFIKDAPVSQLKTGQYQLRVSSKVDGRTSNIGLKTSEIKFGLYSPRFALGEEGFVYPPDQSSAAFPKHTLPKLVLNNALYPHSRELFHNAAPDHHTDSPFCLLMTFHQSDFSKDGQVHHVLPPLKYQLNELLGNYGQLKPVSQRLSQLRNRTLEDISVFNLNPDQENKELQLHLPLFKAWKNEKAKSQPEPDELPINLLFIEKDKLNDWLPNAKELCQLTYAQAEASGKDSLEVTTLLSNRATKNQGLYHCYLLSLENRYDSGTYELFIPNGVKAQDYLGFVILKQWQFECEEIKPQQSQVYLREELNKIQYQQFQLQPHFLTHHLRDGEKGASLYTHPLRPPNQPITYVDRTEDSVFKKQTAINSDQLVVMREDQYDVTYATAWELGRVVALSMPSFMQSLVSYKQNTSKKEKLKHFLNKVKEALSLIPLHYLLPHGWQPASPEIRLFKFDPWWLIHFLKGVYSMGDQTLLEDHKDSHFFEIADQLKDLLKTGKTQELYGFIMHSRLLADFPELKVQPKNISTEPLLKRKINEHSVLWVFRCPAITKLQITVPFKHFGHVLPDKSQAVINKTGQANGQSANNQIGEIVNQDGFISFAALEKGLRNGGYNDKEAKTGKALALQIQNEEPTYVFELKD